MMNFKRGQDPHKQLGLGKHRDFKTGDGIQILEDLYFLSVYDLEKYGLSKTKYLFNLLTKNQMPSPIKFIWTPRFKKGDIAYFRSNIDDWSNVFLCKKRVFFLEFYYDSPHLFKRL